MASLTAVLASIIVLLFTPGILAENCSEKFVAPVKILANEVVFHRIKCRH